MTLYIFEVMRPRTIFLAKYFSDYNFFWRSGGGANCAIITENSKKIQEDFKKHYNIEPEASVMPRNPQEFFEKLRMFIDLDWRLKNGRTIEVTVKPWLVGKFIGRKGRNIRAISKHIGYKITVTSAYEISHYDSFYGEWNPTATLITNEQKIPLYYWETNDIKPFAWVTKNGKVRSEYLAPWKHEYLLDRVDIEVRKIYKFKECGHEESENIKINISRKHSDKVKDFEISVSGYCTECCRKIVNELREDFEEAWNKYGWLVCNDAVKKLGLVPEHRKYVILEEKEVFKYVMKADV